MCIYHFPTTSPALNDPHPKGRVLTYENDAHVITQGLGQNRNAFQPGVLCDGCNTYFGKRLEPALVIHPTLAYDMQRLGVPGKDGGPRPILGNWRRAPDGSVLVPMAPPQDGGTHQEKPVVLMLPILDPRFDQLRFRRGLHLLALNALAFLHTTGQAPDPVCDPRHPSYHPVRRYIRSPRNPTEAWSFLERYDPPEVGGKVAVHLFRWGGVMIGRIRAYNFEFYVDLMNSGTLLAWAESQGIAPIRPVPPGLRYPASPTMDEVLPEARWWLRIGNGEIQVGTTARPKSA